MSIEQLEELEGLKHAGEVVRETLVTLRAALRSGITTGDLDRLAQTVFDRHGARSAPKLSYGFPGTILISVNDEVIHGVPGSRRLLPGDVVKLDVTPELNGYVADGAITALVPPVSKRSKRLVRTANRALGRTLKIARAGTPLRLLGRAIEREVHRGGFRVVRALGATGSAAPSTNPPHLELRLCRRARATAGRPGHHHRTDHRDGYRRCL